MIRAALVALFVSTAPMSLVGAAAEHCPLPAPDRAFIDAAQKSWMHVARQSLRVKPSSFPRTIYFNQRCVWDVAAGGVPQNGVPHEGMIALPDGQKVPMGLMTFAGTYGPEKRPFLVMALPAVWHAEPRHQKDEHLERLIRSVYVHEMTHTVQSESLGARIDHIASANHLGEDLNDDIVQTNFGGDAQFVAAYQKERDLLWASASAADGPRSRALATEALQAMRERRAAWFKGERDFYNELETIFLTMEGLANWAAVQSMVADGVSRTDAATLIRRGGRFWSQDVGMAAFLVIERLFPGWQKQALKARPANVMQLLEHATSR